jgi:hypothetical protein
MSALYASSPLQIHQFFYSATDITYFPGPKCLIYLCQVTTYTGSTVWHNFSLSLSFFFVFSQKAAFDLVDNFVENSDLINIMQLLYSLMN